MPVTLRSFAKINLGLSIGAPRADGFHELLTVYQTIGLHDRIRVSVGRGKGIEIQCDDPHVPWGESNTCFRIAERAMRALRAKGRVTIEIEKRLPIQGGLGGASANAVAALLGLERALKKTLPIADKMKIAAEVGSDLPLFLLGGTVLGVGRGEQVYPLPDLPATACVVVTPNVGVSTPKAFADWDRLQGLKPPSSAIDDTALKRRSSTVAEADEMTSSAGELRSASTHSARPRYARRRSGQADEGVRPHTSSASTLASADEGVRRSIHHADELTVPRASDRMNELGCGLSAWLSGQYSSAPSVVGRRGRAENPLLWLDRAGIKNDFEQVVFPECPELREAKSALVRAGAKYASLSGSGSTLYGLFVSRAGAATAISKLRKQGWAAQATSTLTRSAYWRSIFV